MAICEAKNTEVKELLRNGVDVNAKGGYYGTALQAACYCNAKAADLLLREKVDVNVQGGCYGTALQAASCVGDGILVEVLLEKGAVVNIQGGRYGNALMAAVSNGHKDVIYKLAKNGAKLPDDKEGLLLKTALSEGCEAGIKMMFGLWKIPLLFGRDTPLTAE
ncbi:hypothetical protein GP486_000169 [Trichoglossum hirsutum]|uniref:Ankyrin repeat protein n=1 Tax=Trichoglossum hirsutum TaxID=265104 RepID=A0A9P8LJ20_9PEZI|nr:hypothetical protein GP486_000169 [Trichoglossum hirsutum]